jgi:hypothetical protein
MGLRGVCKKLELQEIYLFITLSISPGVKIAFIDWKPILNYSSQSRPNKGEPRPSTT